MSEEEQRRGGFEALSKRLEDALEKKSVEPLANGILHEIADSNFMEELRKPSTAIIEFYTSTCPYCKQLAPILDELASDYKSKVFFAKINIDNLEKAGKAFDVVDGGDGIDTVVFPGNSGDYAIGRQYGCVVVVSEPESENQLINVEKIKFEDKVMDVSGIKDVVNQKHVAPRYVGQQISINDQGTSCGRGSSVAACLYEADAKRHVQQSDHIGQQNDASCQDADDGR